MTTRISLDEADFTKLVQGEVIAIRPFTPFGITPKEEIEISLQDIGYDRLAAIVNLKGKNVEQTEER